MAARRLQKAIFPSIGNLYIYYKYRGGRRMKSCGQQQTAETYENTHCAFGLLPLLLLLAGPPV
jgi:hypothetical protein